ncbi:MAG: hypothetical protein OEL57_13665, partial [Trichlorobacter sp.]|uniref:hypothetical protein n=1 Tax=Trichlorobacter sp. TaxID=2911007 RepID=UPI00256302A5
MKKLIVAMILVFSMALGASAQTINFDFVAGGGSIEGSAQGGFVFGGPWYSSSIGGDPYMETYNQAHSLTFSTGAFVFNSMRLNGLPWDDYDMGSQTYNTLVFDFIDSSNNTIATRSINLPFDNSYVSFVENISNVHSINFHATGGYDLAGSWINGFWPRLDTVT